MRCAKSTWLSENGSEAPPLGLGMDRPGFDFGIAFINATSNSRRIAGRSYSVSLYTSGDGSIVDTSRAKQSWDDGSFFQGDSEVDSDGQWLGLNTGSEHEHQRLHLDQSGRFWIESWTDYVGDQPKGQWVSRKEAARWYAIAHWHDWRCDVADAPQELALLVRAIGNHRVLQEYAARGGESHREFLAKVQPKLVAARDEVYAELRREKVQQEIQQQEQQRGIRLC